MCRLARPSLVWHLPCLISLSYCPPVPREVAYIWSVSHFVLSQSVLHLSSHVVVFSVLQSWFCLQVCNILCTVSNCFHKWEILCSQLFFILFIFFGTTQCLYFLQLVYFIYVTFPVLASSVLLFTCVHLDCPLGRRHVLWEKGRVLSPGRRSSSILRSAAGLVVEQGGGEGGWQLDRSIVWSNANSKATHHGEECWDTPGLSGQWCWIHGMETKLSLKDKVRSLVINEELKVEQSELWDTRVCFKQVFSTIH